MYLDGGIGDLQTHFIVYRFFSLFVCSVLLTYDVLLLQTFHSFIRHYLYRVGTREMNMVFVAYNYSISKSVRAVSWFHVLLNITYFLEGMRKFVVYTSLN